MIMYDRNGRELRPGDLVVYCPGYKAEIGIVKDGRFDGEIFVRYSDGDTSALTDSALLYKVENRLSFDGTLIRRENEWILKRLWVNDYGDEMYACVCPECGAQAYEFNQRYCHKCGTYMKGVSDAISKPGKQPH